MRLPGNTSSRYIFLLLLVDLGRRFHRRVQASRPLPPPIAKYPRCQGEISTLGDGHCDIFQNNKACGFDGGDCCSCTCVDSADHKCGDGGYTCADPAVPLTCARDSDAYPPPAESPEVEDRLQSVRLRYPGCATIGTVALVGDGFCDLLNVNEECGYDGGDCCSCTCDRDVDFPCGVVGYHCKDPDVSESCIRESKAYLPPEPGSHASYAQELPHLLAWTAEYSLPEEKYSMCFEAGGYVPYVGDGACDDFNSNEECDFDGGDCCPCTCQDSTGYKCGDLGFECRDPEVPISCMEESIIFIAPVMSDDFDVGDVGECHDAGGHALFIGDGECDPGNNNKRCAYDGGDCCVCTCVDGPLYECGSRGGYICRDPTVSAACAEESNAYLLPMSTAETAVE